MRVKAIISYNGTRYYGFQTQRDELTLTIEDVIEKTLSSLFNDNVEIVGSGRTDKGVHALGQVIHFDLNRDSLDVYKMLYAINRLLPSDIAFKSLEVVEDDFHARFNAKSKHYRYIINTGIKDPINKDLCYNLCRKLDENLIRSGMKLFIGNHNFINFCTNDEGPFEREIYDFRLKIEEDKFIFDIYGNGFRRYMVRMIIGTLIELGLKNISLDDIEKLLSGEALHRVRYKAPSEGLYLVEVNY